MFLDFLKKKYHAFRYTRMINAQNFAAKTVNEIFEETYKKRYWRSKESVSGAGSELAQTAILRQELPQLFKKFEIKSLLDLPCGDFNWMQKTNLSGIKYLGGEIVADLVKTNQEKYAGANISFKKLDLLSDDLPKMDCVLVRDCLVHFSYEYINQALKNLKRSGRKYLLTTSFQNPNRENKDIQTGYWRPLNLENAPFFLPKPLAFINEKCSEAKGAFEDKCLILWRLEGL